jgi:CheY-like chemotaxis protein/transcriptional regulator with XRE-family HTH domain
MINKYFSNVLKQLRQTRGFSQEILSEKAGLHKNYISELERGIKSPTLSTIVKIAKAFNISVSDIIVMIEQQSDSSPLIKSSLDSQTISTIEHKINNPLAIIKGYNELLTTSLQELNLEDDSNIVAIKAQKEAILRVQNILKELRSTTIHNPTNERNIETKNPKKKKQKKLTGHILIVDDEEHVRDILIIMSQHFGLTPETAKNGEDALKKLGNAHFDFLLTDIEMPKMNGIELIEHLLKASNFDQNKIIIMTGFLDSKLLSHSNALNTSSFPIIRKPFSKDDIYRALENITS